mmetsp:Transcript_10463/g.30615  ORF Transcript_10463/g.30615 Transcript_10463/m.30615 type:complete len:142 (-) Transcript_10463:218-643(-)
MSTIGGGGEARDHFRTNIGTSDSSNHLPFITNVFRESLSLSLMTKAVAVPITAAGKARINEVKTTKKECGVLLVRAVVVARSKAAMDSYTFGAIATGYGCWFCLWVWSESVVETQRTRTLLLASNMHGHENMLLAKREQGN